MNKLADDLVQEQVENIFRTESRRIFATLIRLLGDFDLAEDALQDAFRVAMEQWPRDGLPENPRAWLVSTGRFKAIDSLRRRARYDTARSELAGMLAQEISSVEEQFDEDIPDDRLRLIFTCCHPSLPQDARAALTLREVCGLPTEAIAHAYLISTTTLAQRIVRAKKKIHEAQIPYQVPPQEELPERLDTVLQVIYLVFNEGYAASSGENLTRPDLSGEAIRLGRLLVELLPEPEAVGLLALMLLHESRRDARTNSEGDLILLEDQDRKRWNHEYIVEGTALLRIALSSKRFGQYTLQAAIAAMHAYAPSFETTDWNQIVSLYDMLLQIAPSPVIEINRAVAMAMRDGPLAGLTLIDGILAGGDLSGYHLAHAARAELYRRLGETEKARSSYLEALSLAEQETERRYLKRRLRELPS